MIVKTTNDITIKCNQTEFFKIDICLKRSSKQEDVLEFYEGANKAFDELQKIFGMLGALIRVFMPFKSTDQACVPRR